MQEIREVTRLCKNDTTPKERKQSIEFALLILKKTLIDTETSIAIQDNRLYFFGTKDYLETGNISKIPRFSVTIEDLVK